MFYGFFQYMYWDKKSRIKMNNIRPGLCLFAFALSAVKGFDFISQDAAGVPKKCHHLSKLLYKYLAFKVGCKRKTMRRPLTSHQKKKAAATKFFIELMDYFCVKTSALAKRITFYYFFFLHFLHFYFYYSYKAGP